MSLIIRKFEQNAIIYDQGIAFINAVFINDIYKTFPRKSKSTQKT